MPNTEIWRDFDANLPIPAGLKNARDVARSELQDGSEFTDEVLEGADASELDEEFVEDLLLPPTAFSIVSETIRMGPGGAQVVDMVLDVEDVQGAVNYEVRITKVDN
jgi:hypothetical protein